MCSFYSLLHSLMSCAIYIHVYIIQAFLSIIKIPKRGFFFSSVILNTIISQSMGWGNKVYKKFRRIRLKLKRKSIKTLGASAWSQIKKFSQGVHDVNVIKQYLKEVLVIKCMYNNYFICFMDICIKITQSVVNSTVC